MPAAIGISTESSLDWLEWSGTREIFESAQPWSRLAPLDPFTHRPTGFMTPVAFHRGDRPESPPSLPGQAIAAFLFDTSRFDGLSTCAA